jgi:hypothetical protein
MKGCWWSRKLWYVNQWPRGQKSFICTLTLVYVGHFHRLENRFYYYTQCHVNVHVSDRFLQYICDNDTSRISFCYFFLFSILFSLLVVCLTVLHIEQSILVLFHNRPGITSDDWFLSRAAREMTILVPSLLLRLVAKLTTRRQNHKRNDSDNLVGLTNKLVSTFWLF